MYVVTVTFALQPGREADFEAAMRENAALSLSEEPGCRQFDVCRGADGRIFLYEIYDDEPAFKAHLASAHFKAFDAKVAAWVRDKQVDVWTRL